MKRHVRFLEIVAQPATRFEQNFLDHVAGVDAAADGRVKAQSDHAPHRLAMLIEELLDGARAARPGLIQKLLRLWRIRNHACRLSRVRRQRASDPSWRFARRYASIAPRH